MRVVLVDDHEELRATLKRMLERRGDIRVVGEATDGAEALAVVEGERPDVVLVDVNLPDATGSECTQSIKSRFPQIRVVAWSGEMLGKAEMLRAGADAFVLKGEPSDRLIEALNEPLTDDTDWEVTEDGNRFPGER